MKGEIPVLLKLIAKLPLASAQLASVAPGGNSPHLKTS